VVAVVAAVGAADVVAGTAIVIVTLPVDRGSCDTEALAEWVGGTDCVPVEQPG
jgi:hypothetical protein